MLQGHAAGIAAAMSAESGRPARSIPMREFQRRLLRDGFFIGDKSRLQEMGLS